MEEVIGKRSSNALIKVGLIFLTIIVIVLIIYFTTGDKDPEGSKIALFMLGGLLIFAVCCLIIGIIIMRRFPGVVLVLVNGTTLINKRKNYEIQLADIENVDSCTSPKRAIARTIAVLDALLLSNTKGCYIRITTKNGIKFYEYLGNVRYAVNTLNKKIEEYKEKREVNENEMDPQR